MQEAARLLEALGAEVNIESGYIKARANTGVLRGGRIVLSSPSVGASETAIMAASLAKGETEILNAARDPEVSACPATSARSSAGRSEARQPGTRSSRSSARNLLEPRR